MSDFLSGFRISGSGMSAQRARLNTISSNIANINTTQTPEGGPYRRKDIVFESVKDQANFSDIVSAQNEKNDFNQVRVADVIYDRKAPLMKFEPNHPDANEEGFVAYPNINLMEEMTNMVQATRSYEANVQAIQSTKDMALSALEIGR
jgi:flagellar basal-body rod protein FlgC